MCCAEIMIRYINTERAGDKVFQFPNRRSFFQRFVKVLPFGLWTANPQAEEGEMIERKCSVPMCGCVVQLLHPMRPTKKRQRGPPTPNGKSGKMHTDRPGRPGRSLSYSLTHTATPGCFIKRGTWIISFCPCRLAPG